jgi:NAD(P)-dependent dehydrogenase (short-subunit alcohol dehydrogenase family)
MPIAGINSAVPMITKGGLAAVTRSLAMEYAKQGIRVNEEAEATELRLSILLPRAEVVKWIHVS